MLQNVGSAGLFAQLLNEVVGYEAIKPAHDASDAMATELTARFPISRAVPPGVMDPVSVISGFIPVVEPGKGNNIDMWA